MGIFIGGEGYGFKIPNQAGPRQDFEQIVGNIDFPPIKALSGGIHVAVMIVVPTLAQGDEREEQAVAAVVFGFITAFAEQVGQRINGRRGMKQNRGADEKSPNQQLPGVDVQGRKIFPEKMAQSKKCHSKKRRNQGVKAIEENEFGEFREVAHLGIIRGEIAGAGDPANMRPPETSNCRRVHILFLIRMFVVMAMLVAPPKRAALRGTGARHGKKELGDS